MTLNSRGIDLQTWLKLEAAWLDLLTSPESWRGETVLTRPLNFRLIPPIESPEFCVNLLEDRITL
jgi:hypothetical protein